MNNAPAARAAKNTAIDRVNRAANAAWRDAAIQAVYETAVRNREFLVDAVWDRMRKTMGDDAESGTHELRAMGPVMLTAVREKWVKQTKRHRASARVTCHQNPRIVWKSLIYAEKAA